MAGNKAAIKSRIKSINATKKITGAMELIASAKLSKQRNQMFKNREYSSVLKDTVNQILSGDIDSESVFLKKKENPKKVYIVFCSDLGIAALLPAINFLRKSYQIHSGIQTSLT